jgi:glycosyltransferase involved in cell wall biosynthesis
MKVLVLTNMYPSDARPQFGVFVKEQVEALQRLGQCEIHLSVKPAGHLAYVTHIWTLFRQLVRVEPQIVHVHFGLSFVMLLPLLPLVRARRIRVVTTFHGSDMMGRSALVRFLSRVAARWSDVNVAVSRQILEKVAAIPGSVARWIPCGIDDSFFEAGPPPNRDRRAVLFPSNPRRAEKNFPRFMEVLAVARQRTGTDVPYKCLMDVPRDQVRGFIAESACMLMTSDYEGSPQTVKECIALGTPVLSTDVGDVGAILDGATHCCVSSDLQVLADALVSILAEAPRARIGPASASKYRQSNVAREIMGVYRTLA